MTPHLPKPRTGQPVQFSARAQRGLAQAVEQLTRGVPARRPPTGSTRDHGVVFVRNDTGEELGRHEPVRLGEAVWSPETEPSEFHYLPAFEGLAPAADHPFAVTAQPIPVGAFGRAVASGVVPVEVTSSDGDPDKRFAALDDSTPAVLTAVTEPTGCEILWREDGSGLKWALVRISTTKHNCPEVHGIAIMGSAQGGTMDLAYTLGGESGTVSIGNTFSAAEVLSAFEGHPGVTAGDVIVVGGPLPSPVFVRFAGELKGQVIDLPVIENNLDGNPQADPWVWWASTVDWRQAVSEA